MDLEQEWLLKTVVNYLPAEELKEEKDSLFPTKTMVENSRLHKHILPDRREEKKSCFTQKQLFFLFQQAQRQYVK